MTDEHKEEGQSPGNRRPGRGRHFRSHRQGEALRRPEKPEGGQPGQAGQNPGAKGVPERAAPQLRQAPAFSCALCEKPIYDLTGALSDKDSGLPVHFDCALERVSAAETLLPGEKIAYLGSGCFGVVTATGDTPDGAFTVIRRIQWEKEGEKKDWRKILSSGITRI
ncbi:MAG: hypothetical protein WAZ99_02870 [Rectinemataceae bacterium]